MKKILTCVALLPLMAAEVPARELPSTDDVLDVTVKVNEYIMKEKYPDPTAVMPYPSRRKNYETNIWTRGVYYEGLMALYSIYPKNEYYDYAVEWADFHRWGMRRDDTATRDSDNYCCAQTYIDLYRLCPEPERLRKTISCMDMLLNTPQNGDWTWIDAIQMGMPVLTKMGRLTGDDRYFEKIVQKHGNCKNNRKGGENHPEGCGESAGKSCLLPSHKGGAVDGDGAGGGLRDNRHIHHLIVGNPFLSFHADALHHGDHGVAAAKGKKSDFHKGQQQIQQYIH